MAVGECEAFFALHMPCTPDTCLKYASRMDFHPEDGGSVFLRDTAIPSYCDFVWVDCALCVQQMSLCWRSDALAGVWPSFCSVFNAVICVAVFVRNIDTVFSVSRTVCVRVGSVYDCQLMQVFVDDAMRVQHVRKWC